MADYILVFNCGSSSLKFSVFSLPNPNPLLDGMAEKLGSEHAQFHVNSPAGKQCTNLGKAKHLQAIEFLIETLEEHGYALSRIAVVGHRVVHGGEYFARSVRIDDQVVSNIRACIPLAPLHNPANRLYTASALAQSS